MKNHLIDPLFPWNDICARFQNIDIDRKNYALSFHIRKYYINYRFDERILRYTENTKKWQFYRGCFRDAPRNSMKNDQIKLIFWI